MAQRELECVAGRGRDCGTRKQRLGTCCAIEAAPVEKRRHGEIVGQRDVGAIAALETKSLIAKRPDGRGRLTLAQVEDVFLAPQRQPQGLFGISGLVPPLTSGGSQSRHHRAAVRLKNVI
jgi:hypothetical protein